jgi:predicted secreted hydrolase
VPHVQFWESNKLPDSDKAVLVATCTMATASQVHLSEQQFCIDRPSFGRTDALSDPSRAAIDNWPQKSRRPLTEVFSFA